MMENEKSENLREITEILEGSAKIRTSGNIFYNPVQEFNRDLSISVLKAFGNEYVKNEGLSILEGLAATGLRSIRYAKEIPNVGEIVANDISPRSVENLKENIKQNSVENIVKASLADASMLMYEFRGKDRKFDAIDLDPYGCPSMFLDSAVQAIKEGGLLLITATDMAVLAGNSPETCYSKYGSISLRMPSCHEMALRILLQCIESHANRYGRYIEPLLSVSIDFYIRVFVRVRTGAKICKKTLSKLASVYHCTGCGSHALQPLGIYKINEKNNQPKYGLPIQLIGTQCEHCNYPLKVGGPIWAGPIHDHSFIDKVLNEAPQNLGTYKRIEGVLNLIKDELLNVPLYYTLEMLTGVLHLESPKMIDIRSAILNAGFKVSLTHMNKTSIKTNAPSELLWDIMKDWEKTHPIKKSHLKENLPVTNIINKPQRFTINWERHPDAISNTQKMGLTRFPQNPHPFWGPGTRSTTMFIEQNDKKKRNQSKRKREVYENDEK